MSVVTNQLSAATIARINALGSEIFGLIRTGTSVRIWEGSKELKNPQTGDPVCDKTTGEIMKQKTYNLDVVVPESMYNSVNKALEAAKNSGEYVSININGQKLVAIKARFDEKTSSHVIQFAKPTEKKWDDSTSESFMNKFSQVFGGDSAIAINNKAVSDQPDF